MKRKSHPFRGWIWLGLAFMLTGEPVIDGNLGAAPSRRNRGAGYTEQEPTAQRTWKTQQPKEDRRLLREDTGYILLKRKGKLIRTADPKEVLRDDEVLEIRHPRGKRSLSVIKAIALPDEELYNFNLDYRLMELDTLSIRVDKQDDEAREERVRIDGTLNDPLVGSIQAKGLTVTELEDELEKKYLAYIKKPRVSVQVTKKSPRARVHVIGQGFRDYEGHERILDVMGSNWQPSAENIYDRVCVVRQYPDGSVKCIIIDMEYMFKYYDFTQNIHLQAGDIIHVRKMPPLLGYRVKWWWTQILSWLNELDEAFNAYDSVINFDFGSD